MSNRPVTFDDMIAFFFRCKESMEWWQNRLADGAGTREVITDSCAGAPTATSTSIHATPTPPSVGTTASGAGSVAAAVEALRVAVAEEREEFLDAWICEKGQHTRRAIDALLALDVPGTVATLSELNDMLEDRAIAAEYNSAKLREQLAEAQKDAHYAAVRHSDELQSHRAEIDRMREQLAAARKDVIVAAGEYRVEVPPPGTPMAGLLSANVALKRENEELRKSLRVDRDAFRKLYDAVRKHRQTRHEDQDIHSIYEAAGLELRRAAEKQINGGTPSAEDRAHVPAAPTNNQAGNPAESGGPCAHASLTISSTSAPAASPDESANCATPSTQKTPKTEHVQVTHEDRMAALEFYSTPTTGDATYDVARLIAKVRHERHGAVRELVEALNAHAHGILSIDTSRALIKKHGGAA